MFWNGFSSSISLATVTPSWVTVGGPHFLSIATFRPLGPRVTLTAFARASIPVLSWRRADSSKIRSFAGILLLSSVRTSLVGAVDDCQDVALAQNEQVVILQLELGAAVLGEQHGVADLQVELDALAVVEL